METNTNTQINLSEAVELSLGESAEFSPYKVAAVATDLAGRLVRPQMVYSYCKQGLIPSHKNELGKHAIARTDAVAWLVKFVTKHQVNG